MKTWAPIPTEFNDWWNQEYKDSTNPFALDSAAYWAWAGWSAAKSAPAAEEAPQQERWCPDVCPITGLPFFMWIEHHETGQMVPTYGGPYDSYTIPVRDDDGSYCRERYDHDNGWWVTDEIEDVGIQIVSDQAYVSDEPPQQPATHGEPAAFVSPEQFEVLTDPEGEGGNYLPTRKTSVGKFTLPLYKSALRNNVWKSA